MSKLFSAIAALSLALILFLTAAPCAQAQESDAEAIEQIEAYLAWAVEIAEDDSHGYSMASRLGPNYDCSSFVSIALMEAGFPLDRALTTYTLRENLEKFGFVTYRRRDVTLRRGDILLNTTTHVEFYLGNHQCVGAHKDYDGRSGDRTGKEIQIRTPDHCPFCRLGQYSYVLRYEGLPTASEDAVLFPECS